MDRRQQTRYVISAPASFQWMDGEISRSGQGTIRDINGKGMFIYSNSKLRAMADLEIEVSFGALSERGSRLRLRAAGFVIRLEPESTAGEPNGFAVHTKAYELVGGETLMERRDWSRVGQKS